jgi:hypothetical protein
VTKKLCNPFLKLSMFSRFPCTTTTTFLHYRIKQYYLKSSQLKLSKTFFKIVNGLFCMIFILIFLSRLLIRYQACLRWFQDVSIKSTKGLYFEMLLRCCHDFYSMSIDNNLSNSYAKKFKYPGT